MEYVMGLVTNKVLLSAVAAWFVAQGSKIILDVMKGTFTFKRLSGGGGMPSAHSATVIGLTTATAIVYGTGGFEFPMALFFAIIVMYDAVGVRLETGREAKALNRLRRRDLQEHKQPGYGTGIGRKNRAYSAGNYRRCFGRHRCRNHDLSFSSVKQRTDSHGCPFCLLVHKINLSSDCRQMVYSNTVKKLCIFLISPISSCFCLPIISSLLQRVYASLSF